MRTLLALIISLVAGLRAFAAADFSIVLLPDTQHYDLYAFNAVGEWIRTNAASRKIQAVIGLGDIVQTPTNQTEWANSTNLYRQIAPTVFTLPLLGNHDQDDFYHRWYTNYNTWYPQSFYTNQAGWVGGFYSGTNSENWYCRRTISGINFLFFGLEFGPRDAVLNWASNTAAAYPDDHAAIFTHSHIRETGWQAGTDASNNLYDPLDYLSDANDGKMAWTKTFRHMRNLFFIGNGHHLECDETQLRRSVAVGDYGNAVMQSMIDMQECNTAIVRILTFHPDLNTCDATTYKTTSAFDFTSAPNQFSFNLFEIRSAGGPPVFRLNDLPFLSAASVAKPVSMTLTNGLTAYWKLDETSGNRADSWGTNTLTSVNSTGATNGIISNGAKFTPPTTNSLTALDGPDIRNGGQLTISAWVKLTNITEISGIVTKDASGAREYSLLCNGNWQFNIFNGTTVLRAQVNSGVSPATNAWFHIVGSYDSANVYIQVNNGTVAQAARTGAHGNSTSALSIGNDASTTGRIANGIVDEVGIWNRILTAAEVAELYNSGAGRTLP